MTVAAPAGTPAPPTARERWRASRQCGTEMKMANIRFTLALIIAALSQLAQAQGLPVRLGNAQPLVTSAEPARAEIFVQTGNSQHVTVARFSADGQWIASCDGLGSVVAWDATSGREFREVHRHTGMCLGVDFTPDGRNVISAGGASSGNEVVMSRLVDGATLQTWRGHPGQVRDVVATSDGRGAWSLGERDGLRRWQMGVAAPLSKISVVLPGEDTQDAPAASAMAMTHNQQTVFVARTDGSILRIDLGADKANPVVKLAPGPEAISALALSPDERVLAVAYGSLMGSRHRDVLLLDTATGAEMSRLKGHLGNVFALAFSPDGKLLATAAQIDLAELLAGKLADVRQHESVRLWRVADGQLMADVPNQRNVMGGPFVRGSLDFSRGPAAADGGPRLVLGMWDEAARVYELSGPPAAAAASTAAPRQEAAGQPAMRLVHTLEGRGLAPRQLHVSDAKARLLVADGRPRIAPAETFLDAATVRGEFGRAADWTEERLKKLNLLYAGRGWLTQVQRASLWDLNTGRLERVIDWQRSPTTDLGVDAQGNFVSSAPLFPQTVMVAPLKTRLVREATVDMDGQISYRHFSYEPWDGPADEIFLPPPAATSSTGNAPTTERPVHAGAYATELVIQSPAQRWSVIAGVPVQDAKAAAPNVLSPRLFVVERLADGSRRHRYDIAAPGVVRAMAVAADERTLWVAGTTRGMPYNGDHEGWLMAIDLADGSIGRVWPLSRGVTVDKLVPHPAGRWVLSNGATGLTVWDKKRAGTSRYHVEASAEGRNVRALAVTADGRRIVSTDLAGWTVLWDWPLNAAPVKKWSRQLAQPSPYLLSFMANDKRIVAGAGDGSVRILAAADGEEIARMMRFDNNEWITMTPEGYFAASPEADRWVNVRMGDKVYGIDQFYDVFYRPDIVERKLAGLPIEPLITVTLDDALRQPPPQVFLQLPTAAAALAGQKIIVHLQAHSLGGGVGEVRVMHNGKLVDVLNEAVTRSSPADAPARAPAAAPLSAQAQSNQTVTRTLRLLATQARQTQGPAAPPLQDVAGEVPIELVAGENAITAIAFNGAGNLNSRPLTRRIQATGASPAPRVFVLAVGIDRFMYPNLAPTLQFAVKDANDFAHAVSARLGSVYRDAPVEVRILHDETATREGLRQALEQLQKDVRPNDLLVWFVASHGTLDDNAQYGIVLHDWDGRFRASSLFSTGQILEAARRIRAFNQFVILDTCHAGGINSLVRGLYDARLTVLARNMGLHVFASASATEEAVDGYEGNGLFTHTLLMGLNTSDADQNADHVVTIDELGEYARRETQRIAHQTFRRSQDPLLMNFGKDVIVYAIQ
ncbi:MAG: caspase family protein [Rhodocyclaceae bacterium]|nr:caspase family protein [Rhodocyclaceae bacterium]